MPTPGQADNFRVSTNPALVAHLYRRAGFGATPDQIEALSHKSWTELVDDLLAGLTKPDPAGEAVPKPQLTSIPQSNVNSYKYDGWQEYLDVVTWWLQRMAATSTPLKEKLTWMLHCQFPTSWNKVNWAYMMYEQNQLFRTLGPGNFEDLAQAVAKDPAMLIWLDTDTSHKDQPNQNFARELMERFTMGIGNYTQEDVLQAARCFSGWELDYQSGLFYFNPFDHDNGVKHVLGRSGNFSGEDIVHIATHTAASHRWVVSRMWSWLGYPVTPDSPIVGEFVPGYAKDLNLTNLLERMLNHREFVSGSAIWGLVKQPVEFVVGTLRVLGLSTAAFSSGTLNWLLGQLGQVPFTPPSVGGWGYNDYWQSTGAAAGYIQMAANLASVANLTAIEDANGHPDAQVDAAIKLIGLPTVSDHTRSALLTLAADLRQDSGSWPAQQIVALTLLAPEYAVN